MAQSAPKTVSDSEHRLGELLENAPDAILELDDNGRVVLLNRMAEQLFGYSREELLGQTIEALLPEELRTGHKRHRAAYLSRPTFGATRTNGWRDKTGPMDSGLSREARRKDGSHLPVEIRFSPMQLESGTHISAVIRDVSARKKAEENQREAEQRFRLIIEAVKDHAIVTLDREGIVSSWNAGAQRIKQYASDEIIGKHFSVFYPPGKRESGPATALETARTTGQFEEEGWRVRRDGSEFWANVLITPFRDAAGKVAGFSKVTRDLTEIRDAQEKIRRTTEDLKHFAYAASHDLREPLRMVAIYTELLATEYRGRFDDQADRFLACAMDGARRMDALLKGMGEYLQASERGEDHCSRVDCNEVLTKALTGLQAGIAEGAVVTHGPLPTLWTDAVLLGQIFQNLVGNAIKYSGKLPRVHVSAEKQGEQAWVFSVRDNGIGIRPEDREKIFEMFNRLHGSDYPGAGIGLAICRKVAKRLGGRIWVEAGPEGGADFRFAIPQAVSSADLASRRRVTEQD